MQGCKDCGETTFFLKKNPKKQKTKNMQGCKECGETTFE
jgi:hypothetical protein